MKSRGLLIVFEGLDRSGKSTQSRLLCEALNQLGMKSELSRFPNRTTAVGGLINDYLSKKVELDDHVVHLLFSANRWEMSEWMKETLNSGTSLILDRYAYSGVAYTSAKAGFDLEWCKQCDVGLPKADLICFLDTKLTCVSERQDFGQERYETSSFQKLVYANFSKLFHLNDAVSSENDLHDHNCLVLDAGEKIDVLHEQIKKRVLDMFDRQNANNTPIGTLWQ